MKNPHLSTAMTAVIFSPVTLAALFRNTRTKLCAVAMSLAGFTQVFGQPVITIPVIRPPFPGSKPDNKSRTLSFFDKYLKNQDDHLLDNLGAVYANIINFRRN